MTGYVVNSIVAEADHNGETLTEWFDTYNNNAHFREAAQMDFTPEQIAEARRLVVEQEKSDA